MTLDEFYKLYPTYKDNPNFVNINEMASKFYTTDVNKKELNLKDTPYTSVKNWSKANNIKLLTIDQKFFLKLKL